MEELLLGGQLPLLAVLVLEQGLLERLKRLETPVDVVLCFLTKKKKCSAMKIIFRLPAPVPTRYLPSFSKNLNSVLLGHKTIICFRL